MRSSPALAATAAAALALVVAGGAWWSTSSTESAIQARSQQVLADAGLDGVDVQADGRDLVITGPAASDERAREALSQVAGTRDVRFVAAGTADTPSEPLAQPSAAAATSSPMPSTGASASGGGSSSARPTGTPASAIRFAKGSSQLDATAQQRVTEIAAYLKEYEGLSVVLIGRTSDEGTTDASLALSWQRAQRVGDAVVAAGIAPSRVSTAGTGEMVVDSPSMADLLRRVDVVYEER
ncbi:MAG: OmpA family protein [Dermatophilus congolensis]|nr:OmpA family protein [Dermatophilus congolensis]